MGARSRAWRLEESLLCGCREAVSQPRHNAVEDVSLGNDEARGFFVGAFDQVDDAVDHDAAATDDEIGRAHV